MRRIHPEWWVAAAPPYLVWQGRHDWPQFRLAASIAADRLQRSGVNALDPETGEQVGWPEFRGAVRAAVRTLPPGQRARAVVFASNYAEAAAVELGRGYGLDNDEQGAPIQVCDGPAGGWPAIWPALIHYD